MGIRYDTELLQRDAAKRGWNGSALAAEAGVSRMTVSRFLRGESQTPSMAKKLAEALGETVDRYLITDPLAEAR